MTSPGVCVPRFHEIVADLIVFKKKGLMGKILTFFLFVTDLIAFKKEGGEGEETLSLTLFS